MDFEKLREFADEHRFAVTYFLAVTTLLLYQHSLGWSWDFSVYSMNGQYFFHQSVYAEWMRAPIASFTMGLLQFVFPRRVSEYVFILMVSTLFFYASYRAAEKLQVDFDKFYVVLMTPAAILFATAVGTEMLSLAFVMLFFADMDRTKSGFWIAGAFLTRYTMAAVIPLVLIQRKFKKIALTLGVSAVPVIGWLGFNYLKTGDPFTSFANFLALNLVFRGLDTPIPFENFALITLPASLLLAGYLRPELREKFTLRSEESYFLLGLTAVISLIYFKADPNPMRYLYPLIFPVAAFAVPVLESLTERYGEKLIYVLAAFNLVVGFAAILQMGMANPGGYERAVEEIGNNCMTESNQWVYMSYAGSPTLPQTDRETTFDRLNRGYNTVYFGEFFENESKPDYLDEVGSGYPETYTVEDVCEKSQVADQTYLEELREQGRTNITPTEFMVGLAKGKYH
ncbi:hypothetical protein [Candidatus Nanohalococcus occultus]|uniref:hypothetical protein n=1 Tax=Candidatus Nanohalococcus occultus TaxID=2978047 RepID=UPI0039E1F2A3